MPATGIGQVRHQNRRTGGDRIQAWTFTERELKLVQAPAEFTTRSERPAGFSIVNHRDRRTIDGQQIHARYTQAVGGG